MRRRELARIKGGEWDALTRWRHLLCVFHNNTGLSGWWKRHYNKRVRRSQRRALDELTEMWRDEYERHE